MKDLVFLGIQGCGKGTQGKLLFKEYPNTVYMEMGQLCRALMLNDNCIGNYIKNLVDNGLMIDNFITHDLLHTTIQIAQKEGKGIMMDGFPRLMEQAQFMIKKMEEYKREYMVIHFELSREKALERMQKRAAIEARKDDTPEAIQTRIDIFMNETLPVIKHFESLGKVITVDADGTIEEVQARLRKKLGL
jgi:adenylate kinase